MKQNKIANFIIDILPASTQANLRKKYFLSQIKKDKFKSAEIEWTLLDKWVKPGDICIDIGANIGRYTLKLSKLVGPKGLVISVEPFTRSFETLTYFVNKLKITNVTLLNAAASDESQLINILADNGRPNREYLFETNTRTRTESINNNVNGGDEIKLGIKIDAINLPNKVHLVKIDVEGNELKVIQGMLELLKRDHPVLIIENNDDSLVKFIESLGYKKIDIDSQSRNNVFVKNNQ